MCRHAMSRKKLWNVVMRCGLMVWYMWYMVVCCDARCEMWGNWYRVMWNDLTPLLDMAVWCGTPMVQMQCGMWCGLECVLWDSVMCSLYSNVVMCMAWCGMVRRDVVEWLMWIMVWCEMWCDLEYCNLRHGTIEMEGGKMWNMAWCPGKGNVA